MVQRARVKASGSASRRCRAAPDPPCLGIGTGSHSDAEICSSESRGIVDAITDHAHGLLRFPALETLQLLRRKQCRPVHHHETQAGRPVPTARRRSPLNMASSPWVRRRCKATTASGRNQSSMATSPSSSIDSRHQRLTTLQCGLHMLLSDQALPSCNHSGEPTLTSPCRVSGFPACQPQGSSTDYREKRDVAPLSLLHRRHGPRGDDWSVPDSLQAVWHVLRPPWPTSHPPGDAPG